MAACAFVVTVVAQKRRSDIISRWRLIVLALRPLGERMQHKARELGQLRRNLVELASKLCRASGQGGDALRVLNDDFVAKLREVVRRRIVMPAAKSGNLVCDRLGGLRFGRECREGDQTSRHRNRG